MTETLPAVMPRQIEYRLVREVTRATRNPKAHDLELVKKSIRRFGFVDGAIHDGRTGRIIAGHGRLESLQEMEQTGEDAPDGIVDSPDGWLMPLQVGWSSRSDLEAESLLVVLNKATEAGGWNDAELAELLTDLRGSEDPALLDLTGFTSEDLDGIIAGLREDEDDPDFDPDDLDDLPAEPVAPFSQLGDVWLLGDHRVVCGDSTDPEVIRTALDGKLADVVWTDPPYGVSYQMDWDSDPAYASRRRQDKKVVANDELTEKELQDFLRKILGAAYEQTKPGGAWYVASPGGPRNLDFHIVLNELKLVREVIIWVKDQFVFGRQDYHWRHEPIFYGWKEGAAHFFGGGRTLDTVWEIPRPRKSEEHPTMKPVELVARSLRNSSLKGQRVLDPCGGSGTTLIAAESSSRAASVVELMPAYVDVICKRWQKLTGRLPVLERTGEPHDFVADPEAPPVPKPSVVEGHADADGDVAEGDPVAVAS